MLLFIEKLDDYLIRFFAYFNYKNYVNRINLQENERVLEVGCGGGNLSRLLAERLLFGELFCVDNSKYWIDKAKKRLKYFNNITFEDRNILNFYKKNYFDAIVISYVLHDINKRKEALDIIVKSLKCGGKIFVREPTRKSHGILSKEIEELMHLEDLKKLNSWEGYSFPLRGKIYEAVFKK